MAVQLTNMIGSTLSSRVTAHFGEGRILYTAPMVICSSLMVLAALQVVPALLLIAMKIGNHWPVALPSYRPVYFLFLSLRRFPIGTGNAIGQEVQGRHCRSRQH
jgi:predicted MFS family arabinose efflux permease